MLASLTGTRRRSLPCALLSHTKSPSARSRNSGNPGPPQTNDRHHPYWSRFSGEPQGGKFPTPDCRPRSDLLGREAAIECSHGRSRWQAIRSLTSPGGAKRKPRTQTPGVPGSFLHTLGITSTPPTSAAHPRTAQCGTRCDPPPATPPARSSAHRPTESVQTNQSSGS